MGNGSADAVKFFTLERLESVYQLYPRKMGKSRGFAIARKQIKNEKDLNDLEAAIRRYKQYVIDEAKEKQYIMHFSTFMNQWRDWLDPDIDKVDGEALDLSHVSWDK